MASSLLTAGDSALAKKQGAYIEGLRFDRFMMVLSCWFAGGLYLDGWAHSHGQVDKTFFTPWHALLYSGYAAMAILIVTATLINHKRGRSWFEAVPEGYQLSLFGVPLFLAGGVGDLIWHTLFGFEANIDALLSPTHLVLAVSATLIISGPLRAAWRRQDNGSIQSWATLLPAVLSLAAIYLILTFFSEFATPFTNTWIVSSAYSEINAASGAASILLQGAILVGLLLLFLRRWQLLPGMLTLLFTLDIALMNVFNKFYHWEPVVMIAIAGVACDILIWRLKPSMQRIDALRIFAFLVPVIYFLCFFASIILAGKSITWSIHLWLGVTVMSGIEGWLLSYLIASPALPQSAQ